MSRTAASLLPGGTRPAAPGGRQPEAHARAGSGAKAGPRGPHPPGGIPRQHVHAIHPVTPP